MATLQPLQVPQHGGRGRQTGPGITTAADPRITPVGRFLRKTKLDELPQLINVLSGEMSLVGPRPEDPRYVAFYTPEQRQVLRVRPGITSAASLRYRDESALLAGSDWETIYIESIMPQKLAIELDYLQRRNLLTDLGLVLLTLWTVIAHGNAENDAFRHQIGPLPATCPQPALAALGLLAAAAGRGVGVRAASGRHRACRVLHPCVIAYALAAPLIQIPIFVALGLYSRFWRYATADELLLLAGAATLGALTQGALFLVIQAHLPGPA